MVSDPVYSHVTDIFKTNLVSKTKCIFALYLCTLTDNISSISCITLKPFQP